MDIQELKPIIELMSAQEERLVKKIDEVITTVKNQNSRIGKNEDSIIVVTENCRFIQEEKGKAEIKKDKLEERKISRDKWRVSTSLAAIAVLITVFGLWLNITYKKTQETLEGIENVKQGKVPIQLIFEDTDSTYKFPDLFMRKPGTQRFTPIHKLYFDIKEE